MADPDQEAESPGSLGELWSWKIVPAVLVTAVVLYALVGLVGGGRDFADVVREAELAWFLPPVALMLGNVLLAAVRFQFVLGALGEPPAFGRTLHAVVGAWPLGLLLPSRSNDFVRALMLRGEVPPWECSGAVLAERWIDFQTVCLYSTVGLVALNRWRWASVPILLWIAALAVVPVIEKVPDWVRDVPLLSRLEDPAGAVVGAFDQLKDRPRRFAAAAATSMTVWLFVLAIVYFLGMAFDAGLRGWRIAAFWPLASIVGMLPLTLAGMGTRDAAFLGLLALAGDPVARPAVLAVTVTYSVVTVGIPSLVGLPVMIREIARM